jgi:TolB protein
MKKFALLLVLLLLLCVQTTFAVEITKIAFLRGSIIYVKDMKTGVEKRVGKGSYPNISPDGTMITYSVDGVAPNKDMTREIRVADLNTGRVTEFESLKHYLCYGSVWSPDSKKLAFGLFKNSRWEAVVMNYQTRDWKIVTQKVNTSLGVSSTTWSADSNSVLTQDLDSIYILNLRGDLLKKLSVSDIVDDISYISSSTTYVLSVDGKSLIFDTDQLPDDKRAPMIWAYDLSTKKRKQISSKTFGAMHPVVLPDDEIVFTGFPLTRRRGSSGIYKMKTDGTQVQLLVANADEGTVAIER